MLHACSKLHSTYLPLMTDALVSATKPLGAGLEQAWQITGKHPATRESFVACSPSGLRMAFACSRGCCALMNPKDARSMLGSPRLWKFYMLLCRLVVQGLISLPWVCLH